MVKHVILWTLRQEYTEAEKKEIKEGIRTGLLSLAGQIPGLLDIQVITDGLETANVDVMLDSTFIDEEALKQYAVHPAHQQVANEKVRPFTAVRACMDYEA